jgi:hypothetical protein
VLDNISYSGSVICFVGGTKASKYNETSKIDEIDGFIYFPSREKGQVFAIIVEAKNYNSGAKDAVKQLKVTIPYLSDELEHDIISLSRCAYMELKIKS